MAVYSVTLIPGKEKHTYADEKYKNYEAAVPIDYDIVFSGSASFVIIVGMNSIKFYHFKINFLIKYIRFLNQSIFSKKGNFKIGNASSATEHKFNFSLSAKCE